VNERAKRAADRKPRGTVFPLLGRFWELARVHRAGFIVGMVAIPFVAGAGALRPLLLKEAVDVYIPASDAAGLRDVSLLFLAAVITEFIALATQVYALQVAGHRTIYDLRTRIFRHVLGLRARFFDKHSIGSLLSRSTSDVEALSETLSFGVFTIVTDAVMVIAILVAMFALNWKLTLFSLSISPILFVLVRIFSRVLRSLQLEVRRAQGVQTGYLAEQLNGVSVVQLHGREQAARAAYVAFGRRYLRATKMANIFDALLFSIMDGISAFCVALLVYLAAPGVLAEERGLTLGLLFAFVAYLQRIFIPIREFSGKLATIQRAAASLERIYRLLDHEPEPRAAPGEPDPLKPWKGAVEVRGLRFRYRDDGPIVLDGLDFDIAPGEVVAVVGRTGSGKTSLGRILTRFYDGYEGSVRLVAPDEDGSQAAVATELRDIPPDHLRRHLLMVQQDVFLFDDDVAFNVTLGDPQLQGDADHIREALATAQAADFIEQRGGLGFGVGERGRNLSVGEAQLLAFARVAARTPTMLILDEATASVDSATEQRVQEAIERILEGRSVLVIAHRLSTVRHADKILVLSKGRIVEQGDHESLMARNGVYSELYESGLAEDPPPAGPQESDSRSGGTSGPGGG
jgi:ATP-binding cassette subfamily B protein